MVFQPIFSFRWRRIFPDSSKEHAHKMRIFQRVKWNGTLGAIILLLLCLCPKSLASHAIEGHAKEYNFAIPQQSADIALTLFAEQANLTLVFPHDKVREKQANEVVGRYTLKEASYLLLKGTGLKSTFRQNSVITISLDNNNLTIREETRMINKRKGLVAFLASIFSVSASVAQESEATDISNMKPAATLSSSILEEILVTARRWEESRQDVPMAISVLNEKALDSWNIRNVDDLTQSIPGLTGTKQQDPTQTTYAIRGQTQIVGGTISLPGVVDYFAEVPQFSSYLYDLQSVQVLKGPQGTLFGRNTTGGAILFTPAQPTEEFSGYAVGRTGNYNLRELEFAIGGAAFDDRLLMRLSGQKLKAEGYTDNLLTGRDIDNTNRESYRLSVIFRPSETFENYTILQYESLDERSGSMVLHAFEDNPLTPFLEGYRNYLPIQQARGPRKVELTLDPQREDNSKGIINTTTWDMNESWSLKNIASYRKAHNPKISVFDSDGAPFPNYAALITEGIEKRRTLTEEFQVQYNGEKFRAIAGAYYERRELPASDDSFILLALPGSTAALPFVSTFQFVNAEDSRSKAAFLNASIDNFLVEGLNVTAGVRYTDDEMEQTTGFSAVLAPGISIPILAPFDQELNSNAVSWNLSADYAIREDLMGYASIRRGYKGGGFNLPSGAPDTFTYDPEYVTSHEIGLKFQHALDRWEVLFNVAVFYDDYTDIQRNLVGTTAQVEAITTNAADADMWGADLELVLGRSNFTLSAQYSWLHAEYREFINSGFGDLSDSEFNNAPEHQFTLTPTLTLPLSDDWGTVTLTMPFFWQSETYYITPNTLNGAPLNDRAVPGGEPGDSFYNLGLNAAWTDIAGTRLSAKIFGRNITDETYTVGGISTMGTGAGGGVATRLYAPPRTYGLELRYDL